MSRLTYLLHPGFLLRLRHRHFLLLDALILCVIPALALMLRVDGICLPSGIAISGVIRLGYETR